MPVKAGAAWPSMQAAAHNQYDAVDRARARALQHGAGPATYIGSPLICPTTR